MAKAVGLDPRELVKLAGLDLAELDHEPPVTPMDFPEDALKVWLHELTPTSRKDVREFVVRLLHELDDQADQA